MAVPVTFVTHYAHLYGANRSLLDLLDGLGSRIAPHVVAPRTGDLTRELGRRSVPFSIVPFRPWVAPMRNAGNPAWWIRRAAYLAVTPAASRRLARIVRAHNADLVYSNASVIDVGARAARLAGVPHVWHVREFGAPDYDLDFLDGHNAAVRFMIAAGPVITNSVAVRDYHFDGAADVTVIPNGVRRAAAFGTAPAPAAGPFTFAIIGLLQPRKGQHIAIEAFAAVRRAVPRVRLLVAGGGDDRSLRDLARRLGVADAVEFLGYVADPFAVYERAHAVLMCSDHEAWGRVTAEAMAAARPVIGRASGGTPELVQHERTGLLYDGSTEALAQAMIRLARQPEWARELGAAAWSEARRRFTIEEYADRVFAVIERAIGKEPRK